MAFVTGTFPVVNVYVDFVRDIEFSCLGYKDSLDSDIERGYKDSPDSDLPNSVSGCTRLE